MNGTLFALTLLGLVVADVAEAESRWLRHAVVFDCTARAAPISDANDAEIQGAPIVSCRVSDSRTDPAVSVDGELRILNDENGAIVEMAINATIWAGDRRYRIARIADAISYAGNGATYLMQPWDCDDVSDCGWMARFHRRTPDLCWIADQVVPCPDRVTMLSLQLSPSTSILLDFRPE